MGAESLKSFPVRQHLILVTICYGEDWGRLSASSRRALLEPCSWFPLDFIPCDFFLHSYCFVSFTVINSSWEYNYMLNPMSHASERSNLKVILGTPPPWHSAPQLGALKSPAERLLRAHSCSNRCRSARSNCSHSQCGNSVALITLLF